MATIEQVEKLLQYADVSYEEARDALDICNGSLLDAIVFLERQGKVPSKGGARNGAITALPGNAQENKSYTPPAGESFMDMIRHFLKQVGEWFDGLCERIKYHVNEHESHRTYRETKHDEQRNNGESEKL